MVRLKVNLRDSANVAYFKVLYHYTPSVIWNPKVHYSLQRIASPVPIHSVRVTPPISERSISILSSNLPLKVVAFHQVTSSKSRKHYSSPKHPTCPAHLFLLDFITRIIFNDDTDRTSPHYVVTYRRLWSRYENVLNSS